MMHCFDRRQIVFGGALIGSTAVLPGNVGALFDLHFRKGTAVPGWMERTTHAGFFGANVAYTHGPCKLMQRRFPEEHVFKLLESAYPHVKNLKASYLRPLVELQPGECLIRYRDARVLTDGRYTFRVKSGGMTMSGGSKAVMWIEDGDDLLLCGIPTDRTVRINERLAVTISLEATSART